MNSLGKLLRISVFGESHGREVGILIDGFPPGLPLNEDIILKDIDRRRSGARGTTARKEYDIPEITSGVFEGKSTGAPILIRTGNTNIISSDYKQFGDIPRPGHADMVARHKYHGYSDTRGGGHFSGRLTWGMVAAGSLARNIIKPAEVNARIISAGGSTDIENAVNKALKEGDSIGGIIECKVSNMLKGLGEPLYYSVEAAVSQFIFSIPAIKGLEFGSGFRSASMKGSEHNDPIINEKGETSGNNAGGINGGISNGNDLVLRVAVKPTSSISMEQQTYNMRTEKMDKLIIEGRHDACIALRIPVIIEAAVCLALADLTLINKGING